MKGRSRLWVGLGSMLLAALIGGCARHAPPAPVIGAGQSSPAPAPAAAAPHPNEIIVQRGDTIYSIARRYKVPVRSIIEANGIGPPYELGVGRRLTVPQAQEHNVQPGETLASVAQLHGVDASTLARTNGLTPPY